MQRYIGASCLIEGKQRSKQISKVLEFNDAFIKANLTRHMRVSNPGQSPAWSTSKGFSRQNQTHARTLKKVI